MAGTCTGLGPCDTSSFGTGKNWVNKVGGLPAYIRAVAHAFRRKGLSESEAIQRAVGVVKNWAEGKGGVTPATRARAAAAVAEWESKKAAAHSLTAEPAATIDLTWDPAKHPRAPKGTATGGKFTAKNSSAASDTAPGTGAQVRDFQRRTGLPVTGVIDAATAAKIRALTEPTGGGGKGGKGKAKKGSRARISRINSASPAVRAAYRNAHPTPPAGYAWGPGDTLHKTRTARSSTGRTGRTVRASRPSAAARQAVNASLGTR